MYTHFTFTLMAHCTSGAIRGSVSCSRTLRQGTSNLLLTKRLLSTRTHSNTYTHTHTLTHKFRNTQTHTQPHTNTHTHTHIPQQCITLVQISDRPSARLDLVSCIQV